MAMENHLMARVLLVDDEEEFLKSLSLRLEMRGLKATMVNRGEDAMHLVEQQVHLAQQ